MRESGIERVAVLLTAALYAGLIGALAVLEWG